MNHQRDMRRRRARKARSVFEQIQVRSQRPRLCVFRSNHYIYAQVIDDAAGRTVAAASSREPELVGGAAAPAPEGAGSAGGAGGAGGKVGMAIRVGLAIAERARKAGVEKVVFDRRHYRFHGRVKALADAARKGGLSF